MQLPAILGWVLIVAGVWSLVVWPQFLKRVMKDPRARDSAGKATGSSQSTWSGLYFHGAGTRDGGHRDRRARRLALVPAQLGRSSARFEPS